MGCAGAAEASGEPWVGHWLRALTEVLSVGLEPNDSTRLTHQEALRTHLPVPASPS